MVKLLGYAWSGDRDLPAVRDELAGSMTVARRRGWDGLLAAQRVFLWGRPGFVGVAAKGRTLGVYFAYDWNRAIALWTSPKMVFFVPSG